MIRLNPRNDVESAVRAGMLPGARLSDPRAAQTPIAVLLPMFAGTHDKLGVSNLTHDQDGVVRRYAVWWPEAGFALPSVALRAARLLGGANAERAHDEIILNWRNKRGDYRRISFADYYLALEGGAGFPPDTFKDAVVILGASAPGIANTKPTASAPVLDDNVIVATAIDDIVNDTHLRVLPGWASALISCLLVLLTARAFQRDVPEKSVNRWFVFAQGALVVVTVGSASYSVYLVDLSACFLFGLGYFFIAKAYAQIDHNASRGMPSFTQIRFDPRVIDRVAVFGFDAKTTRRQQINRARGGLEHRFGFARTFHIDNAFGVANLFGGACKGLEFFVVFLEAGELPRAGPGAVTASALFGPAVAGAKRGCAARHPPPSRARRRPSRGPPRGSPPRCPTVPARSSPTSRRSRRRSRTRRSRPPRAGSTCPSPPTAEPLRPVVGVEADHEALRRLDDGTPDHRRLLLHQLPGRALVRHRRLRGGVERAPRRPAAVEQPLPAGLGDPAGELGGGRRRLAQVDEGVRDIVRVEPGARLLHGVAVRDSVEGEAGHGKRRTRSARCFATSGCCCSATASWPSRVWACCSCRRCTR
jgi:hypothetical protein